MSDLDRRIARLSPEKRLLLEHRLAAGPRPESPGGRTAVAVIGMACRLPGARSPEEFWQLLLAGRDAIREVPPDRWDAARLFDPDVTAPGRMATRWGGFLDGIDGFDAEFFGLAPREAERMDPQQRLLLEVAWEALEHAGRPASTLRGSDGGVFVGMHSMSSDYYSRQVSDLDAIDAYTSTGNAHSLASNRISYLLDLRGPSVTVDTACSSSLVALHLACQSLRAGECDLAIVGGVNLVLTPEASVAFSKLRMMAADGRCKTFDARADGFVRSEGCGVVVLRRLDRAREDCDPVLAVIRGSAVNQDGGTNGLTAPSGLAQRAVVRRALADAGLTPDRITYVETHGTGTALGDPIEVDALVDALACDDDRGPTCVLGAVKTNIGHLEAAAGIAGLLKAVLCLRHRFIPGNLHFGTLNPHITLEGSRLVLPAAGVTWQAAAPRAAGVSSFGFGGTNAHVIVEEFVETSHQTTAGGDDGSWLPLPLSATTPEALRAAAQCWVEWLRTPADVALHDIARTAAVHRDHHRMRRMVVGRSRSEWAEALEQFAAGHSAGCAAAAATLQPWPGLTFVYSGQGSQWAGMGQRLYATQPVFRDAIDRCAEELRRHVSWSLHDELNRPASSSRLNETAIAQPLLFAIQHALTELWRSWGVEADAVVGHSAGEIAAAHAAGLLDLEDAVRVVACRGQVMAPLHGAGSMAAIEMPAEETRRLLETHGGHLELAAINSASSCVVSGEPNALLSLLADLPRHGIVAKPLGGRYAFHSRQLEPLQAELAGLLTGLKLQTPRLPFASTVSGRMSSEIVCDAEYWARNMREPVRFADAVQALADAGHRVFLELSPHPVLTPMIARSSGLHPVPTLRRGEDDDRALLAALAELYELGAPIDFQRIYPSRRRAVALPSYPWQRRRYWFEGGQPAHHGSADRQRSPDGDVYELEWHLKGRCDDGVPRPVARDLQSVDAIVSRVTAWKQRVGAPGAPVTASPETAAVACGVSTAIERVGDTRTLRVLQLGGESRVSAEEIKARLVPGRTEYVVVATLSDFLQSPSAARSPSASGTRLDPVRDLDPQRIGSGQFDIVIASGQAFHGEPRRVVERVRDVLSPGGLFFWMADADDAASTDACATLRNAGFAAIGNVPLPHRADSPSGPIRLIVGSTSPAHSTDVPGVECDARGTWCLFADRSGVAAALERLLVARGGRVVTVSARVQEAAGDAAIPVDPTRAADFDRLATQLAAGALPLRGCIHLWALDGHVPEGDRDVWEATQSLTCGSAIQVAAALTRAGQSLDSRLWLVTRGAQDVGPVPQPLSVLQAPLWGAGRVVALERPELWGGVIDLDPSADAEDSALAILREVMRSDGEDQVVLRQRDRYVPRLARKESVPAVPVTFRQDRAYLVTGGTRGLGLQTASWMADTGAGWLVLAGRHGCRDSASQAIVDNMRRRGVVVEIVSVDISDAAALAALVRSFGAERPLLGGVVHAAGVIEVQPLTAIGDADLQRVMAPKVAGAWHLHELTRELPLDHFILFSSAAAVLGSAGMACYAAANHFLDALARERRRRGLPATSINWGRWAGGGGSTAQHEYLDRSGMDILPSRDALAALANALAAHVTQCTVARIEWPRFAAVYTARRSRPLLSALAPDVAPPDEPHTGAVRQASMAERLRRLSRDAAAAELMTLVRDEVARVLGSASHAGVDPARGFFALGMDSIMSVELRTRLQEALGIELAATVALEHPTVLALSRHLLEEVRVVDGSPAAPTIDTDRAAAPTLADVTDDHSEEELAALLDRTIHHVLHRTASSL